MARRGGNPYGFGLFRAKYYLGEALDFGIPTYDGAFGSLVIDSTMTNARQQPINEVIAELDKIVHESPPDDKTQKRNNRLAFLQIIDQNGELKTFYETINYYLNGGPIDWTEIHPEFTEGEPDVCVIASGGNIITIFANLIRLSLQGKGHLLANYLKELCIVVDKDSINAAVIELNQTYDDFSDLVFTLSESLPSDLDFKVCPIPVGDDAIPEDHEILNVQGGDGIYPAYQDEENHDAQDSALHYLAQVAANAVEDTPLLNRANLDAEIEETAEELATYIRDRPQGRVFPGPKTRHLYTQVVQQSDLGKYQNRHDRAYVEYLLNEKALISTNTKLNSMCMAAAFNNNPASPPLVSFMFAIHMFAIRCNSKLNSILWDNDIEIPPEAFNNLNTLKNSGLFYAINGLLVDMHTFPLFTTFMGQVDEIMEDNAFVTDNAGSSWCSPELCRFVDISEFDPVYQENLRITMNIIRPKYARGRNTASRAIGEVTDEAQEDKAVQAQSEADLEEASYVGIDEGDDDQGYDDQGYDDDDGDSEGSIQYGGTRRKRPRKPPTRRKPRHKPRHRKHPTRRKLRHKPRRRKRPTSRKPNRKPRRHKR